MSTRKSRRPMNKARHKKRVAAHSKTTRVVPVRGPRHTNRDGIVVPAVAVSLIIITLLLFGRTFSYPFINFDDPAYILERPEIARGVTLSGIAWSFTHPHGGNWHPLTSLSHMLDCQLFHGNAGAHHFVNVLLHAFSATALFLVLRRMTEAVWRSALVALVFAIHPLRVESVAWIAERKDVLSGLFFMLTMGAYVRYVRKPSILQYVLVLISLACGLMAKPMLVTVPFLLLLLDYWPLRRYEEGKQHFTRLLLEKLPLLVLALISAGATIIAQRDALSTVGQVPLTWRISNALVSYCIYIGKSLWPAKLGLFYPFPQNPFPGWQVSLAAVLLIVISFLAISVRGKSPWFLTAWFWYLGMLVPVIGIIQVGMQSRADRYTYLPGIGLAIALVWGFAELTTSWRYKKQVLTGTAVTISLALVACTWSQVGYWRDSETLWKHTIAVTSNNDVAHAYLADLLLRENRIDESRAQAEEALRIRPDNSDAQNNLALALFRSGRLREASDHWQRSLALKPDSLNAQCNFAWLLATSPEPSLRDGSRAIQLTENVINHAGRDNPSVLRAAGAAYAEAGQFGKAIALAEEALQITRAQGNEALTEDLQHNIVYYRHRLPLRDPGVSAP